jgi:hypothetical protein
LGFERAQDKARKTCRYLILFILSILLIQIFPAKQRNQT